MKKLRTFFIGMLVLFGIVAVPVNGTIKDKMDDNVSKKVLLDKQDILTTNDDFKEVYTLDEEILRRIKELCTSQGIVECPEYLDYEKAVKVYVGADLIQMNHNDKTEILKALENSVYVWVVPAQTNTGNFQVTIARGLPLSEDAKTYLNENEQQEIRDNEGKWGITSVSYTAIENYWEQIREKSSQLKDCTKVVFVGGQSGFSMPVAIGLDETKAKYLIGLGFQYPIAGESKSNTSIYEYDSITTHAKKMYVNDSTEQQWGGMYVGGGPLLPAVERQQTIQTTEPKNSQQSDLQSLYVLLIAAILLCGTSIFRKIYWKKNNS